MTENSQVPIRLNQVVEGVKMVRKVSTKGPGMSKGIEQSITWDFNGCTLLDIFSWAERTIRIERQKVIRQMEYPEDYLTKHPTETIIAKSAGMKVLTTEEIVNSIPDENLEDTIKALQAKIDAKEDAK